MIHFILADDHNIITDHLSNEINVVANFTVLARANNYADLIHLAIEHKPDVILTDFRMPSGSPIQSLHKIKRQLPTTKVIVFTGLNSPLLFNKLYQLGIDGIILKEESIDAILEGISCVAERNEKYFSPAIKENIFNDDFKLSVRELEIIDLIVQELSTREIAKRLNIAYKTVENHRYKINKKLKVNSPLGLSNLVRDAGFFD